MESLLCTDARMIVKTRRFPVQFYNFDAFTPIFFTHAILVTSTTDVVFLQPQR